MVKIRPACLKRERHFSYLRDAHCADLHANLHAARSTENLFDIRSCDYTAHCYLTTGRCMSMRNHKHPTQVTGFSNASTKGDLYATRMCIPHIFNRFFVLKDLISEPTALLQSHCSHVANKMSSVPLSKQTQWSSQSWRKNLIILIALVSISQPECHVY